MKLKEAADIWQQNRQDLCGPESLFCFSPATEVACSEKREKRHEMRGCEQERIQELLTQ